MNRSSGSLIGAHQKIDRVARKMLKPRLSDNKAFPKALKIQHFEGHKGPDSIKVKSPSKDEPWHYFDPFDKNDDQIFDHFNEHSRGLSLHLAEQNVERAAFEAAWLAHALVDGLTPAHHYPYEKEIEEIWGKENSSRDTRRKKWLPPGDTKREIFKKFTKAWGPKGLITTHMMFELGIATIITPMKFTKLGLAETDLKQIEKMGVNKYFEMIAKEIAVMDLYNLYIKKGWTAKLTRQVKKELMPRIIKTVALSWYLSAKKAKITK
ncbi:MAG: hypothetical protein M3P98_04015 [bacterium]|nr:hypothetical protein [bacterium]